MQILFVHQNFPSQYQHIVSALGRSGRSQVISLGIEQCKDRLPQCVTHIPYALQRGNTPDIHPFAIETESKVLRGEACARAADELKHQGFTPDIICAHPGWGETLFMDQIWPNTPQLLYQEFFYQTHGFDCAFDPELQGELTWQQRAKIGMKNANILLSLQAATWNVTPTHFQRSSFPEAFQSRFSTIHDGVDTRKASPAQRRLKAKLPNGLELSSGMPIVTFVNRRLEPYRGCHTFIRAIPELQRLNPDAQLVIIGETTGVSYGSRCQEGEWHDQFLREIQGQFNEEKVHFLGRVEYSDYLHLLKMSACHVYLTYPFVLSWSLLEAMACGCPVVGSATEPVMEVIKDGINGLLVDFFQPNDLATAVSSLLNDREQASKVGANARQTVLKHYSIEECVPRHLALMELVASGSLSK